MVTVPANAANSVSASGHLQRVRLELIDKWLSYFGVDDPLELDLGTLMSVGERVRDGIGPPN